MINEYKHELKTSKEYHIPIDLILRFYSINRNIDKFERNKGLKQSRVQCKAICTVSQQYSYFRNPEAVLWDSHIPNNRIGEWPGLIRSQIHKGWDSLISTTTTVLDFTGNLGWLESRFIYPANHSTRYYESCEIAEKFWLKSLVPNFCNFAINLYS